MKRGKRLILYLMDGDPTDRIKCKLDNRTSIAYKIPRTSIDKCKNIPHLEQSGIYFLFGTDHELNDIVYVGQACVRKNKNGVLSRILENPMILSTGMKLLFSPPQTTLSG